MGRFNLFVMAKQDDNQSTRGNHQDTTDPNQFSRHVQSFLTR